MASALSRVPAIEAIDSLILTDGSGADLA